MPIYAYKCGSCGHAKDVLQKVSDAPLTACPACGAEAFSKQVTAAGFQLKGSGWYVTDFRNGNGASKSGTGASDSAGGKPAEAGASSGTSSGGSTGTTASSDGAASKPADSTPSGRSDGPVASAGGCGSACACH
ncbi:FmdB family zinc ribbon protein [Ramlibacter sp. AN1015]|uniref:FmdB family zinc ribbon protein n=1 Tax=Ramlibacter sp. AN1015 TaxID=3133428 RepID=UPI0030BFA444